jgi:hypothetical protein
MDSKFECIVNALVKMRTGVACGFFLQFAREAGNQAGEVLHNWLQEKISCTYSGRWRLQEKAQRLSKKIEIIRSLFPSLVTPTKEGKTFRITTTKNLKEGVDRILSVYQIGV